MRCPNCSRMNTSGNITCHYCMNTLPFPHRVDEDISRESVRPFRPRNLKRDQPVVAASQHETAEHHEAVTAIPLTPETNEPSASPDIKTESLLHTRRWLLPVIVLGCACVVAAGFITSDYIENKEITAGNAVFAQGEKLWQRRQASAALSVYRSFLETFRHHPLNGLARHRIVVINDSLQSSLPEETVYAEPSKAADSHIQRLLQLAESAVANRRFDGEDRSSAHAYLAEIYEIDPANLEAAKLQNLIINTLIDSASTLHINGNLVAARRVYQKVLEITPEYPFAVQGLAAIGAEVARKKRAATSAQPFSFASRSPSREPANSEQVSKASPIANAPLVEAATDDNRSAKTAVKTEKEDRQGIVADTSRNSPPEEAVQTSRPRRNTRKISLLESALNPELFPDPNVQVSDGQRSFDELGASWYRFRHFLSQDVKIYKQTPTSLLIYRGNRRNYLAITKDYTPESHIYSALEQKRGGNPFEVWVVNRQMLDGQRIDDKHWQAFFRPEFVEQLRYTD